MLVGLSRWFRKLAVGWVALLAFIGFLLFTALVLPRQTRQAPSEIAGERSPDTSLVYTADELYAMAEAYGELGRRVYVRTRMTFDVLWPIVYAVFLILVISWVYGRTFSEDSVWQLANILPLLGAVFDYLENISTSIVMWRYPQRTPFLDHAAPMFTFVKWILVVGSFLLLGIGLAVASVRWVRRQRKPFP